MQPVSERPTGCLVDRRPDPFGRFRSGIRRRRLLSGGQLLKPIEDIDWRQYFRQTNQQMNSCTAFGRSQAGNVYLGLRGVRGTFFDPYRNYYYSRRRHRIHDRDDGSYVRSAFWAGRFGDIDTEGFLRPYDEAPKATDDLLAVDASVKGDRIFATGEELVWRIADSLVRLQPVEIGLPIDRAFAEDSGPVLIDKPTGSLLNLGHAGAIIGCVLTQGLPNFWFGNSWRGWREAGTALITGRYIADLAYDVHFVRGVKWDGRWY